MGCEKPEKPAKNPPQTAPREVNDERMTQRLLVRVSAFALLTVGMNFWLTRHFGIGLENPWALVGITTAGISFSGVLDWFLEDDQKKQILAGFRNKMRRVLTTPLLVLLYAASFVLALTVSSITVVPELTNTQLEPVIKLFRVGQDTLLFEGKLEPNIEPFRVPVTINPLGGYFLIDVEGYLSKTVRVLPFLGVTINPDEFLEPVPSVLFRPTVEGLKRLEGGSFVLYVEASLIDGKGELIVTGHLGDVRQESTRAALTKALGINKKNFDSLDIYQVDSDNKKIKIGREEFKNCSFLVGSKSSVPSSYFQQWKLELTKFDPEIQANTMLAWYKPKLLKTGNPIRPGVKIRGVILSNEKKLITEATVIINREKFIDVQMQNIQ